MTESIDRYREIFKEFLLGRRDYDGLPPELREGFAKNFAGSYHWMGGILGKLGETAWNEIVSLEQPADHSGKAYLRLEGAIGGQAVALRYRTGNRGGDFWGCSGTINGQALNQHDAGLMAEKFLTVHRIQYALDQLENAFSQIALNKEQTIKVRQAEQAALQPLAHLLRHF